MLKDRFRRIIEQVSKRILYDIRRQKICILNGGCNKCLTKEQSMPDRPQEHVLSLTGYVKEKLYMDLHALVGG